STSRGRATSPASSPSRNSSNSTSASGHRCNELIVTVAGLFRRRHGGRKIMNILTRGAFVALCAGLVPAAASAQGGELQEVILSLPANSLTFSAHYIANDAGFYEKEGLKVTAREITGVGSVNAVLGGSADFTIGTGATFLRAVAAGQKLIAIANM